MKIISFLVLFICLFVSASSFAQTLAPSEITNNEITAIQNQVSKQDTVLSVSNSLENKKELIITIDSKKEVAKAYHLLQNKFRQLSLYKLRTVKA
jgi:hypothetical protein